MNEPILIEVYGQNDGENTVPVEGTVKVGDSLAIFVGPEKNEDGLLVMLRSVVAAMHLSNKLGLSHYNIGRVMSEAASDHFDVNSIQTVIHACKHHKPNSSDQFPMRFAAVFVTPGRSEGMSMCLDQVEQATGHTCSSAGPSRQECPDAE